MTIFFLEITSQVNNVGKKLRNFTSPFYDSLSGRTLICFGSPIGKFRKALGCRDFASPSYIYILTNQIWYLEDSKWNWDTVACIRLSLDTDSWQLPAQAWLQSSDASTKQTWRWQWEHLTSEVMKRLSSSQETFQYYWKLRAEKTSKSCPI